MKKTIIPWHVFLDALRAQSASSFKTWIRRWRFMDSGAVLIDDGGISVPKRSWLETKAKPAQTDSTTPVYVDATKSSPQSASTKFASPVGTTPPINDSFREL